MKIGISSAHGFADLEVLLLIFTQILNAPKGTEEIQIIMTLKGDSSAFCTWYL